MPFFSPVGYGYRFDTLANVLVSLLGVADDGQREKVDRFIQETLTPPMLLKANQLEMDGQAWSFPEYVHGVHHTPGGTRHLCWRAAAAVIGAHALQGENVFRGDEGTLGWRSD